MIFLSILILIVAIALPSINRNIVPIFYSRISAIIFIYAGAISINALYIQSIGSGIGIYSGLFQTSIISQIYEEIILLIGSIIIMALCASSPTLKKLDLNLIRIKMANYSTEYSLIVLISTLGSILLLSSADLISLYLSIELQSFGVYILASLYRNSESAISAGLKYYLLGGLSSCIILFGCCLIYSYSGLTQLDSIYNIISVNSENTILWGVYLGIIFIIIGLLIKIGAAPLHNWAPDVYDNSPTIVTIWLTIMPKIAILIFLIELQSKLGVLINNMAVRAFVSSITSINSNLIESIILNENSIINTDLTIILKNILLISSLMSLLIGTILGLSQTKIKRLLAYSTISHLGFILLALSINSQQSIESVLFYIIQYSITNLNIFLILITIGLFNSDYPYNLYKSNYTGSENDISLISQLKGIFFINPLISICLTICLFSMAGIPPLLGFFAKQFVLSSALQNGYYFMSLLGIIVSIISASYYLKIIKILHTENNNTNLMGPDYIHSNNNFIKGTTINSYNSNSYTNTNYNYFWISNTHSFIISTLTLAILFFVFKPSILLNITTIISLSLFYF